MPCTACGGDIDIPDSAIAKKERRSVATIKPDNRAAKPPVKRATPALQMELPRHIPKPPATAPTQPVSRPPETTVFVPATPMATPIVPKTKLCPACAEPIAAIAKKCKHCGWTAIPEMQQAVVYLREKLDGPEKSNLLAGCLGFFLGPVGLWYKGQWAAGFAWIMMIILIMLGTGGLAVLFAPFFWVGMAVHAAVARPKW
jgi:hypothetical protein